MFQTELKALQCVNYYSSIGFLRANQIVFISVAQLAQGLAHRDT